MTSAMDEKPPREEALPTNLVSEDRPHDERSSEGRGSLKTEEKDKGKEGEEEQAKPSGFGAFFVRGLHSERMMVYIASTDIFCSVFSDMPTV